jgi:hypothetical protein
MIPEKTELSLSWQPNKGTVSEVGEHGFKHLKENLRTFDVAQFFIYSFPLYFCSIKYSRYDSTGCTNNTVRYDW